MNKITIGDEWLKKIFDQAEREYPNECCGMIMGAEKSTGELSRLRPCKNVQDEYHRRDPENFPRTAGTAYFIEPRELLTIQKELREKKEAIRIIYHSHINAGAYFSEEDTKIACQEGEPTYPGVQYLVVSVANGKVKDRALFVWDSKSRKFVA